jgi:hypothetical protein
LSLIEGVEKPHVDKYKEIMNDWNYDASCRLISLPVWDLEHFKCLVFVAQSVHVCGQFSSMLFIPEDVRSLIEAVPYINKNRKQETKVYLLVFKL